MGGKTKKVDKERIDRYLAELDAVNPEKHWEEQKIQECNPAYVREILWRKYNIVVPIEVDNDTVRAILCIRYLPKNYSNRLKYESKKISKDGERVRAHFVIGADDGIDLQRVESAPTDSVEACLLYTSDAADE